MYQGQDEEFNLSDDAWDLICCLITDTLHRIQNLGDAESHPFFKSKIDFNSFRNPKHSIRPPFVPRLVSDTDTRYFDDFENPESLSIYGDVRQRVKEMEDTKVLMPSQESRSEFIDFGYSSHWHFTLFH